MKYVIDSNILIDMKHFYPKVFPNLWIKMNELINNNEIISVKEALNELTARNDFISEWATSNEVIFKEPEKEEYQIIKEILAKHKELLRNEVIASGRAIADPFLIAKAKKENATLITNETLTPNAHKIPNICQEYEVSFFNLEDFMLNEGWQF
jgi:hypothetical protein